MKKTATIISLFVLFLQVSIALGQYIPRPENQKFEGKWKFSNAEYSVTITLVNYKNQPLTGTDIVSDFISGEVTMLRGGKRALSKDAKVIWALSPGGKPFELKGAFSDGDEGGGGRLLFSFPDTTNLNRLQLVVAPTPYPKGMYKNTALRLPRTLLLERVAD